MTFDSSIQASDIITWAIFVAGGLVGWVKVVAKVDIMEKDFEKHEQECAEKNKESAALRMQQAQIQQSSITQLASVTSSLENLTRRIETVEKRQWDEHGAKR
jgi:hypothetical protein